MQTDLLLIHYYSCGKQLLWLWVGSLETSTTKKSILSTNVLRVEGTWFVVHLILIMFNLVPSNVFITNYFFHDVEVIIRCIYNAPTSKATLATLIWCRYLARISQIYVVDYHHYIWLPSRLPPLPTLVNKQGTARSLEWLPLEHSEIATYKL